MDPGSESEEDSGPAMVDDPEDQTFEAEPHSLVVP